MNSCDSQVGKQNAMVMNPMMGQAQMPSNFMSQDINSKNIPPMKPPPMPALIGTMSTDESANSVNGFEVLNRDSEIQSAEAESSTHNLRRNSRDRGHRDRRDRTRERRHRSRSYERKSRNDYRNNHDGRERVSKWGNDKEKSRHNSMPTMPMSNMMMPGSNMLPYNNMMHSNMMGHQQIGVQMPNMMPGMDMMPNMLPNMMSNMMDANMMMMNQQMMPVISAQVFLSFGSLLPPLPGSTTPERRECPKGCRTIVVGGLPSATTNEMIMEIFQRFGEITEVKSPNNLQGLGIRHVRFATIDQMEHSFLLSGYRFKFHDQMDSEATTMYIDYAINREDENEYEKCQRRREKTPPRVEQFSLNGLTAITDKIKNEEEFTKAATTLAVWLERGECNKKNANNFYSLVQASNNHFRRLFNEKMQLEEEFQNLKASVRERFGHVVMQFEQVVKILTAAKHQRVSDHFSKQQRRNVEMWLKMTEEVENIKEEFINTFYDDDSEKTGSSKNMVSQEKYEALKAENENLIYELEGYKNEAFLAKDEAERKFEKFKAHFIAQQALLNKETYRPMPPSSFLTESTATIKTSSKPKEPSSQPKIEDDKIETSGPSVPPTEAKLISILTAFLLVHPLGASLDYLVSYVKSLSPNVTQATVHQILQKYADVFCCTTSGVGASIEHRWKYVTFDHIKKAE